MKETKEAKIDYVEVPVIAVRKIDLFPLGRIVLTPGAWLSTKDSRQTTEKFLSRHRRGDFGDVTDEHRKLNEMNLAIGLPVMSAYRTSKGEIIVVITEGDRSSTCVMLLDEA